MTDTKRDVMAPENEPTDEELAIVMREARDEAVRRHALAEKALRDDIDRKIEEGLAMRELRRLRLANR